LDIDQNTSHVWRALVDYAPRVAVIEYNASFPADVEWEVPYDAAATWDGSLWYGASLATLTQIGRTHGLALVGCNLTGSNAFFVRDAASFAGPHTAAAHYQPTRGYLLRTNGHPRGWR
jgi:hypothetical protein